MNDPEQIKRFGYALLFARIKAKKRRDKRLGALALNRFIKICRA